MRTSVAISSLLYGLALANPVAKRQDLGIDDYESVAGAAPAKGAGDLGVEYIPEAVSSAIVAQVSAAAVAQVTDDPGQILTAVAVTASDASQITAVPVATVEKRAPGPGTACTSRTYNGPLVTVPTDSPEAFLAFPDFATTASAAAVAAALPSGYMSVPEFVNLQAAAKDPSYITYTSSSLKSYDVAKCAALCDAKVGCVSFNIYYERDPAVVSNVTQVADSTICPAFADSPSVTRIFCAFYGMPIVPSMATNVGQYQGAFKLVIAGSNAYTKSTAPSVNGFDGPIAFGNATINAPAPVVNHGYLQSNTIDTTLPFDPSMCATSCDAQTVYNAKHGTFGGAACNFFNAYIMYKNGANGVFKCAYYSIGYDATYATNVGQYNNAGDHWTIGSSFGYYKDYSAALTKGRSV